MKTDWPKVLKTLLPTEHGSTGLFVEPLAIGLILVPRAACWLIAAGCVCCFLSYRPSLMAIGDLLKRKRYPRTFPALVLGALFGLTGASLIVIVITNYLEAASPLEFAVAVSIGFIIIDRVSKPRSLWREVAGSMVSIPFLMAMVAVGINGQSPNLALERLLILISLPFILRTMVTVLTVRAVIGRFSDAAVCRWIGLVLTVPLILTVLLSGFASLVGCFVYTLVGARALWVGMTPNRERTARGVGFQEIVVATLVTLCWNWPSVAFLSLLQGKG